MMKQKKQNIYSTKSTYLGPPENIGKQTYDFKESCKSNNNDTNKKVISHLTGDPNKTCNVILKDLLSGKVPKEEKVYKPCERLLRKLKKQYHVKKEDTSIPVIEIDDLDI